MSEIGGIIENDKFLELVAQVQDAGGPVCIEAKESSFYTFLIRFPDGSEDRYLCRLKNTEPVSHVSQALANAIIGVLVADMRAKDLRVSTHDYGDLKAVDVMGRQLERVTVELPSELETMLNVWLDVKVALDVVTA